MKTNQAFINEYRFFDDIFECTQNCQKEATIALYDYNNAKRQLEMKAFFESTDIDTMMEKENEGFLSRIGNAAITLVHKIAEFIQNITEKILGNTKLIKSDEEKVSKILSEHPELKKQVCDGIKKDWFTYKDVASYEKDIVGLVNMLEKNAIDHQTFMDKVKKAAEKFNESAKPIIGVGASIAGLLTIVPKIHASCKEAKDTVSSLSSTVEDFKNNVEKNYGEHDQNKATSILNALSQAVGLTSKECSDRVAGQSAVSKLFNKFANSKVGSVLKLDDTSRDARHQGVKDKINDRKAKEQADADAKKVKDEADAKAERRKKIDDEVDDEVYRRDRRKANGLPVGKNGKP